MKTMMISIIKGNRNHNGTKSFHTIMRLAEDISSGDDVGEDMLSIFYFTFNIHSGT